MAIKWRPRGICRQVQPPVVYPAIQCQGVSQMLCTWFTPRSPEVELRAALLWQCSSNHTGKDKHVAPLKTSWYSVHVDAPTIANHIQFFGCGLPFPAKLEGCRVLDLGSGSGRDCYAFSKLVGQSGHVTGIDMTEEMITASRHYTEYHQKKFGYKEPNVTFVQGYMEKLSEAGIQSDSVDVVVSNCVICLCPDKRAVLQQAYNVLKEGGELYFSDMYASKVVPDHLKQDPVLWGEGMGGSLFWQDLISLAHSIGFSTPHLVSASHIVVYNSELSVKAGDISYASGTYRLFKLPKSSVRYKATVTYKGTMADFPDQLDFDSSHCFKKGVAVEVNAEMARILHSSRFLPDFEIHMLDKHESSSEATSQYCHLNPFLLADKLGSSVRKCSKN